MNAHTQGPWRYSRTHLASSDYWYVITDAEGFGPLVDVGGKDKNGQIAEAKYLITDEATIEANARLIAAAPELLEALKGLQKVIRDGHLLDVKKRFDLCVADATACTAIAKAEGKVQS